MDMLERLAKALAGRYRVEREIGRGGMATVFLAEDLKHERKVAIKVLHPELGVVLGVERFLTEIKTTANLQHPNILALFDSGEADGLVFYVMPYVEGETLRARMTRMGQLSVNETVRIVQAAASALDYAHRHGVIHRDVKPENILLQDGQAMVADFGVALAIQNAAGQRITATGWSVGTPQYNSPEQAAAEREVDGRSDQYSLAAIAYEMLAGEAPFTGATGPVIVSKLMTDPPPPLDKKRPAVPDHVVEAIHRALEKQPADRFDTVAEFSDAIGSGKTGMYRAIRAAKIRRRASYIGAAALAGLALGIIIGRRGRATATGVAAAPPATSDGEAPLGYGTFALAHDGTIVVTRDPSDGHARLAQSRLDRAGVTPIAGTELGVSPFISWGARSLGFVRGGEIFVVPLEGGVAIAVPGVRAGGIGAPDWTPDGRIVYTDTLGRLAIVGTDGTGLTIITTPAGTVGHVAPKVLSNGQWVLFTIVKDRAHATSGAQLGLVSLQTKEVRVVVDRDAGLAALAGWAAQLRR
jgi:tRNA A-37 threonylcarbamoyl transferase component Bud32